MAVATPTAAEATIETRWEEDNRVLIKAAALTLTSNTEVGAVDRLGAAAPVTAAEVMAAGVVVVHLGAK